MLESLGRFMLSLRKGLRVGVVLTLGAYAGAAALAVSLIVLANVDSGRPIFSDISLGGIFWPSLLFFLFTLPISWLFGAPLYWLLRHFNLLRVWVCSVLGGIIGMLVACAFRLFAHPVEWLPILWFVLSGAAAGTAAGLLLRRPIT
jgi:hypothetical protein